MRILPRAHFFPSVINLCTAPDVPLIFIPTFVHISSHINHHFPSRFILLVIICFSPSGKIQALTAILLLSPPTVTYVPTSFVTVDVLPSTHTYPLPPLIYLPPHLNISLTTNFSYFYIVRNVSHEFLTDQVTEGWL